MAASEAGTVGHRRSFHRRCSCASAELGQLELQGCEYEGGYTLARWAVGANIRTKTRRLELEKYMRT